MNSSMRLLYKSYSAKKANSKKREKRVPLFIRAKFLLFQSVFTLADYFEFVESLKIQKHMVNTRLMEMGL